jgi:hypothetical protein
MHAQTVDAANWWARSRGETNTHWITNYQKSLRTRHRDVIVDIVRDLPAVTSVLEVGSHCGPNLVRLAQEFPAIEQLSGVDVNADAITAGIRWVHGLGLSERIGLSPGRVPDATSALPDGCVDVVLSCYALAYIAPQDLDTVLYEMGRLARTAIVLAEPMTTKAIADERMAVSGYREWAHNYQDASRWIGTWRGRSQRIVPVAPPVDRLNGILVAVREESTTP